MKILVIGSGGREHALVWKIAQSKRVSKIYCAPGNPGISGVKLVHLLGGSVLTPAENVPIKADDLEALVDFAKDKKIDLTIVGPEIPLIEGITDLFEQNGLVVIGPSKKASQIEGSKVFAKKLMLKYDIPSAKFAVFDDYNYAKAFLKTQKYPQVLKADGQCAGKGVAVCRSEKEAQKFLKLLMQDKIFGSSGNQIIVEECLNGQEISFIVATDGKDFVTLLLSQDHKPIFDEDRGPNTGGMGAYAPVSFVSKKLIKRIEEEIVAPTIKAMAKEGCIYKGILYPGLILTKEGPKVLEFNCRFGDPETQPLMMLLKSDIVDLFGAIVKGRINNFKLKWHKKSAVCVVLTSPGYPGKYRKGEVIYGLPRLYARAALANGVVAFHAGTKESDGEIVTGGGRVVGITATGSNLAAAMKNAYKYIGKNGVHFSGMHYRKDIGKKGLNKKLWL